MDGGGVGNSSGPAQPPRTAYHHSHTPSTCDLRLILNDAGIDSFAGALFGAAAVGAAGVAVGAGVGAAAAGTGAVFVTGPNPGYKRHWSGRGGGGGGVAGGIVGGWVMRYLSPCKTTDKRNFMVRCVGLRLGIPAAILTALASQYREFEITLTAESVEALVIRLIIFIPIISVGLAFASGAVWEFFRGDEE